MIITVEIDNVISTPVSSRMALDDVPNCTLLPGAKEALDGFKKMGHTVIIFTRRDGSLGPATEVWLQKNQIPYQRILCNKPIADLSIDHHTCKFTDWPTVLEANKYLLNNLR